MSRKIEFRIWDTQKNQWVDFSRSDIGLARGKERATICFFNFGDNHLVEQYTGLKDKNGKEIYEGDIIKRLKPHEFLKNVEETEIFRIRWGVRKAGFFAYSKERKKHNIPAKRLNANDVYEVIGNIHENPELLEVKND